MASIARALRSIRRELDKCRTEKPAVVLRHDTAADRNEHLSLLEDYHDRLTGLRNAFKDVQRQYLAHEWSTDADQNAAAAQSEEDGALIVAVELILTEIGSAIRRLTTRKQEERENAKAKADREAMAAVAAAPRGTPSTSKLPKLQLPTFDGKIFDWPSFWDRFRVTVDANDQISAIDKLIYLKGQLSGDAEKTISGLSLTEINYDTAVKMLQERFGNKDRVVDAHFKALEEIPPAQNQRGLRAVVDQLELHMNSLAALEQDVNHRYFDTLIRKKLPPAVVVQLEKERREDEDTWNVDTLRDHLRSHLQICEAAYQSTGEKVNEKLASSPSPSTAPKPQQQHSQGKRGQSTPQSTTGALFSQSRQYSRKDASQQGRRSNDDRKESARPPRECPYCDRRGHFADECTAVPKLSDRKQKLIAKKLCFNCLNDGHSIKTCNRQRPCYTCKKVRSHHSSLCPVKYSDSAPGGASMIASNQEPESKAAEPNGDLAAAALLATNEESLLQTATATLLSADDQISVTVRGLFDNGSQRSFITEQLAKQLKLKILSSNKLSVFTFGSIPPKDIDTKVTEVKFRLLDGSTFSIFANVIPAITGTVQRSAIDSQKFSTLFKDLPLADTLPIKPERVPVHFLIGSDYMWDLLTGEKVSLANGLSLISSKLGWLLGGRLTNSYSTGRSPTTLFTTTLFTSAIALHADSASSLTSQFEKVDEPILRSFDPKFLWDLETIGIKEKVHDPGDEFALQKFNDTVIYENGRYYVTWPWKESEPAFPTNFELALARLNSQLRRYKSDLEIFRQYHQVIQDQLDKTVIEPVDDSHPNSNRKHYIPHHAVITPGRTTKLRVVYDGSAKGQKNNPSLNDCLYRGPVMLDDIVSILIRFRLNKVALAADIEKAFLQVGLQEPDRDVTRFLWLKNPSILSTENNLQVYRFTRVPFGIVSSPFLLAATIDHHLRKDGGEVAMTVLRNIYVDNIIVGADSDEHALNFYRTTKDLFQAASMNAREWMSNSKPFMASIPDSDRASGKFKILGVPWNPDSDSFSIICPTAFDLLTGATKRLILQHLASYFDPMGLACPSILVGKIFLQKLWLEKIDWDTVLSPDLQQKWTAIAHDLQALSELTIPRFIGSASGTNPVYELHAFCDASHAAYGVCIYLRILTDDDVSAHLLFAKARLAPIRSGMTTPKLELLGAHIGAKCLNFVASSLPFPVTRRLIWTDSKCVLHWLHSEKTLTVFVRNRINEIKSFPTTEFRYLPTSVNPADLASRGAPISTLAHLPLWWKGPAWLVNKDEAEWPKRDFSPDSTTLALASTEESSPSLSAAVLENSTTTGIGTIIDYKRYSSLSKLLRVTSYVLRFLHSIRKKPKPQMNHPTAVELNEAETVWIKYIQRKTYSDIFNALESKLKHPLVVQLSLWLDEHGLLRCGGRLTKADLPTITIHPILLPKKDHFTTLIIRNYHQKLFHAGVSHTLSQIRIKYWIPAGRSAIFNYIRSCTNCKKHDGGPYKPPSMPPLPASRVTESPAFSVTGLDYLGPVYFKDSPTSTEARKAWVCIFTCLSTRAVHLELVPDMTAEQFLLCLRRFISRRGSPATIISDNGPQFKLVQSTIGKLWQTALTHPSVHSYVSQQCIQWKFITERAPWQGGFYERLVSHVKRALKKSLGKLCLTFHHLETILFEIEAVINSRPLAYVGSDLESGQVITPAHFLALNPRLGTPALPAATKDDPDYVHKLSSKEKLLDLWKRGQSHLETFWKIWSADYLLSLRERYQTNLKQPYCTSDHSPRVGDIVQIRQEGPRGSWHLARITRLFAGTDNEIRSAEVRTPSGHHLLRSVMHLYPLECDLESGNSEDPDIRNSDPPTRPPEDDVHQQAPVAPRPQRKAADQALRRIQDLAAANQIASFSDIASKPTRFTTTSSISMTMMAFIALLCLLQPAVALRPRICTAGDAKVTVDLSNKAFCEAANGENIGTVYQALVLIYKRNIAQYSSDAWKCKRVKSMIFTYTDFAKWDTFTKNSEAPVPVSEDECQAMIRSRRCSDGPLLGGEALSHTDNVIEPEYSSGNGWDCCFWKKQEITNCYLIKGKAYDAFRGQMESNLGNVAHCEYEKRHCLLSDSSALVWTVNRTAFCEFVEWRRVTGKLWNGRFLSDDMELALTWSQNSEKRRLCDGQLATITDQGYPIIYTTTVVLSDSQKARNKRNSADPPSVKGDSNEPSDLTAARLQAFELRLDNYFRDTLNLAFHSICRSIRDLQEITLILAHAEPTLIARKLFNDSFLMARLSGNLLDVWPCVAVDKFSALPMPAKCRDGIPMNFTLKGKASFGFMDPKTSIIYRNAAPSDCELVHEITIQDDDGAPLIYSATAGTISPHKSQILHHPLHTLNFTLYSDFQLIIHRSITMYTLAEIRATASFNDFFETIEVHDEMIREISHASNQEPLSPASRRFLENVNGYSTYGFFMSPLGQMIEQGWIYVCCGYVTASALWHWCLSKGQRQNIDPNIVDTISSAYTSVRHRQAKKKARKRQALREEAMERPVPTPGASKDRHGSIQLTVSRHISLTEDSTD